MRYDLRVMLEGFKIIGILTLILGSFAMIIWWATISQIVAYIFLGLVALFGLCGIAYGLGKATGM